MKLEDQIIFLCTRQTFLDDHKELIINHCQENTIDWDYIFQLAMNDGVISLIGQNLFQIRPEILNIPSSTLANFRKIQMRNISIIKSMEIRMIEILSYFDQKDIDVMLIKGEALNFTVYKEPWLTMSADIDLILRPRHKNNFVENEIAEINHFIYKYNHKNTIFKQHIEFDIFEHHDVTMNRILPIDFNQIWENAEKIPVYGNEVHIMTPEDTLIALAINSCRKRYFKLKSLCDIAELIHTTPQMNWTDVANKSINYKCNNILYTAIYITEKTIGCPTPPSFSKSLKVNPIRLFIIRVISDAFFSFKSLSAISHRTNRSIFTRNFSLPLFLTYTTYGWGQIIRKITKFFSDSEDFNRSPLPLEE